MFSSGRGLCKPKWLRGFRRKTSGKSGRSMPKDEDEMISRVRIPKNVRNFQDTVGIMHTDYTVCWYF